MIKIKPKKLPFGLKLSHSMLVLSQFMNEYLGISQDDDPKAEPNCDGGSFFMSQSIGPAKVTFQTLEDCFKVTSYLIN